MLHGQQRWGGYQLKENGLWLSDVTTGDVSTAKHGFAPKAPNDATKYLDGTGAWSVPSGGAGGDDHAFYTYLAAALEPLAYEQMQSGAFSYAIGSTTKLLMSAWACRIGASGRIDVRDGSFPLPIRNQTLVGTIAGPPSSAAAIIDPSLATYADARTTYYDRLNELFTSDLKVLALTAPSTNYPLPPGPYGTILVHTTTFDYAWITPAVNNGVTGLPTTNEIGDTGTTDYQRVTSNRPLAVSKNWMHSMLTGEERSAGVGKGFVLYYICPASWGKVTDATSYIFRDDFLGASLDTGTDWTRSQSTAGNIEINTDFAWCKLTGSASTWGLNGAYSQTSTARANGKVFLCDIYTGNTAPANQPALVGWSDGGGHSYTNFAHGVFFSTSGGVGIIAAFEGGTNRGTVGSGWSPHTIYRVRITLGASNDATYEIQGGSQYAALGGSSWTDITPGTSSNSTTPLHAGFTTADGDGSGYVGDVKLY